MDVEKEESERKESETAETADKPELEEKRAKPTPVKKNIIAKTAKLVDHIPILFLPCDDEATKVMIYFHANAEDIGLAFDLLHAIGSRIRAHVIAVEYPGYGLYKSSPPNEAQIKEDSVIVYDYLT